MRRLPSGAGAPYQLRLTWRGRADQLAAADSIRFPHQSQARGQSTYRRGWVKGFTCYAGGLDWERHIFLPKGTVRYDAVAAHLSTKTTAGGYD